MTRHLQHDAIIERARLGALTAGEQAHVDGCHECAGYVAQQRALTAGLRALAASAGEVGPSGLLEARLLAAFAAHHASPRRGDTIWPSWMAAAAAIAVLVTGAFYARADFERARGRARMAATAAAPSSLPSSLPVSSEFVPWPGAGALPAFESGQLVRMELPASVLSLLGIVPAGANGKTSVLADVLVGQDGLARAVRLAPVTP